MIKNYKSVRRRRIFVSCLFFLSVSLTLSAQDLLVSGQVTDGQLPISGANVLIKNTTNGVVTDFDGRYTITARPTDTLQISYLGYTTLTIPINNHSTINVTLQEDATALGEVQINAGYYSTTDREKTGSIARITAKEIELQPVNNPLGAMQGYMSGVNIVQNTGVPGGGYDIQIRGKNFINGGTDPLFIVDGVPFSSQSLGATEVSGLILRGNISPLNSINPNDIESIEVLKDADATAIYGSRGANGVVLITSKKGIVGKTQLQIDFSNSLGQVSNFVELMNTEQYLEVRREGIINDGFEAYLDNPSFDFAWPDLKTWDQNRYTDWQKELIGGNAHRRNAQLRLSGGNPQTRYLISAAHQNESTVFPGKSNYKKTSVHNNINHHSQGGKFTINLSTIYTHEKNSLPQEDFSYSAYTLEPNAPKLYNEVGELNWENNSWDNPLASLLEEYRANINSLNANTYISYKLMPNLEFKSSLGFNSYRLDSFKTLPSSATNPALGFIPQNYSNLTTNASQRQSWIVEPQLQWKHQWKKIKLDILFGTTFQKETNKQLVQKGTGYPNNSLLRNLAAAEIVKVQRDMDGEYSYTAVFGRINLNLDERYILNLTGRRDGSSRFGPGRQFGNFGAVGIAWVFSEEDIFKNNTILSFGKFRASYGITGSDNIGDYKFLNTYNITGYDYDGTTALQPTGIFNPIFGWESNKKLETAIELALLKDRINLTTSWYRNKSSNQLIGIPLAATTGFSQLTGNFDATVENTGFEMDIQTVNLKTNYLKWSTSFNITLPENKLVKFDDLENSTFANRYVIGQPLTIVKLYHALGVNPETGIYQFKDYNGDGNISSLADRQWAKDLAPEFYGGFGNTLSYGNLTLNVFFQFKKQQAFNLMRFSTIPGYRRNAPVDLFDRWQQNGDIKAIQKSSGGFGMGVDTGSLQQDSSAAVSDASFIRLRNISLNYKVPQISNNLDINVYLQGQNLLTFTNYKGPDPEYPSYSRLPPLRQFTLGMKIAF
ncbi:SusC/RagA family TonB-linked outer membrane protein [Gelidibacter maritimus]|uniref:SusC/RagA family TonB-linked outer membrane protein n=1 Tax=Gelidibacter maritimus TaxID=2761487 RepID=A0A7W2M5H2_9FLAO|nr:SusC/RagA family TonB-linked outer membrane protein [Gelidibacter maritimus]MBA6153097.1 SusC/RagA family TonB-linked outer membrane protein [Gelidibacter maritimus]